MHNSNNQFTFDEMMLMFRHWDDYSRAQFSDHQYQVFLNSLNALASDFGRPWVEQLAGVKKSSDPIVVDVVGNDNVGDGATGIMRAIQFHEDWNVVKGCKNSSKLRAKIARSYNDSNADLEVHVAAAFAKGGSTIELEPTLLSGRVSDFRVQLSDGSWLYGEVSKRHFKIEKLEHDLQILLELCLKVSIGRACSLHILGEFHGRNSQGIKDWLSGLEGSTPHEADLDGIAEFRDFHHGHDVTTEILSSRAPPLQMKSEGDIESSSFATIYYYVPDFGFDQKFAEEREQLPAQGYGIIVIDVTGIAGSLAQWHSKALAALSVPENAHILGVILLGKGIDYTSFPRWRFDAKFAVNPKIQDFPVGSLELIRGAFGIAESGINEPS